MKKSNLFIIALGLVLMCGMTTTNIILKKEYLKIDLTDVFKNYISVESRPYSVLDISGSNGYPIEIVYKETNDIKVLRSRIGHFKSTLENDTLFVQFTGSNISREQTAQSNTPAGIIIEKSALSSVIIRNTHNRLFGFSDLNLELTLKGSSLMEINNCDLNTLKIDMKHNSRIDFLEFNTVDSLDIRMSDTSIVNLQKIDFSSINHSLADSITLVLSKETFNRILSK